MDKPLNIFEEQLKENLLDDLLDAALKDKRVIQEAFKPSLHLFKRDVMNFINTPNKNFTVSVDNLQAIHKLSTAVYRVYFRSKVNQCKKLRGEAKRQCLIYNKMVSWKKVIEKLNSLKDGQNDKKINFRINEIKAKITRLRLHANGRPTAW